MILVPNFPGSYDSCYLNDAGSIMKINSSMSKNEVKLRQEDIKKYKPNPKEFVLCTKYFNSAQQV